MATKKLARTVIEGGRGNVWERRNSTQKERAQWRMYLSRDAFDDEPDPRRENVRPHFTDKLNPARRWLASRTGRLWADVKSELHQKFEGPWPTQHVIYEHMLRDVVYEHEAVHRYRGYRDFIVTSDGVLQESGREPSRYPNNRRRIKERYTYRSLVRIHEWLKGRYVEKVNDSTLYWVMPWKSSWERCTEHWCPRQHRAGFVRERFEPKKYGYAKKEGVDETGLDRNVVPIKLVETKEHQVVSAWLRGEKLNDHERQFWKTLNPRYKERILKREF